MSWLIFLMGASIAAMLLRAQAWRRSIEKAKAFVLDENFSTKSGEEKGMIWLGGSS